MNTLMLYVFRVIRMCTQTNNDRYYNILQSLRVIYIYDVVELHASRDVYKGGRGMDARFDVCVCVCVWCPRFSPTGRNVVKTVIVVVVVVAKQKAGTPSAAAEKRDHKQ